jgi:hypothetical protein
VFFPRRLSLMVWAAFGAVSELEETILTVAGSLIVAGAHLLKSTLFRNHCASR